MSQSTDLWYEMLADQSPLVNETTAKILYHRAAASWAYGQKLEIADGVGGYVEITKLFEQYRILQVLKGENQNEK